MTSSNGRPPHTLTPAQIAALDAGTDRLVDVETAADFLRMSPVTIRAWARNHHLPHAILGGYLLVLESALMECERDRRHAPQRAGACVRWRNRISSTAGGQTVS